MISKFKVGDFITDGTKVYVYDRDKQWHYVDSGNHANIKVSKKELKKILGGKAQWKD